MLEKALAVMRSDYVPQDWPGIKKVYGAISGV
jgi:hypothetical protein